MANERTENGATPAYFAAQNGNLASLQHLVKKAGANVHLRANDGMQPVHAAAQTGQLHCVIWLVRIIEYRRQQIQIVWRGYTSPPPAPLLPGKPHTMYEYGGNTVLFNGQASRPQKNSFSQQPS